MRQVPDKNDLTHTFRSLQECLRRVKAAHGAVAEDITRSSDMIIAVKDAGNGGNGSVDAAARHALNGQRLIDASHDLDAIEMHIETIANALNIDSFPSEIDGARSKALTQSDVDVLLTEAEK